MKSAIVFGANGFIGSHVTESLQQAGYQVGAVIRPNVDSTFLTSLGVTLHTLESFSSIHLEQLMKNYDLVYNCTADVTPNKSLPEYNKTQVDLSCVLAQSAHKAGIKRFLQLSTVEVYGKKEGLVDETSALLPKYAFQKSCVDRESALTKISTSTGLEVVLLRPSATFGRRSPFVKMLLAGHADGNFQVLGSGKNKFSGVDTRDIGRAFVFLGSLSSPAKVYLLRAYEHSYLDIKNILDDITETRSSLRALPTLIAYPLATLLERFTPKSKVPFLTRFIVSVASSPGLYNDAKIRREGFTSQYTLRDTLRYILQEKSDITTFSARGESVVA
ncbi:MAG: NAD-dependent epimerase/dehydratase family protein [Candidatus Scalindua sp.]